MTARLLQTSNEPGAQLDLHVTLTEAEVPFAGNADVHVQLTYPDNTVTFVQLATTGPGIDQGNSPAPLPGIYLARFLTTGTTRLVTSCRSNQKRLPTRSHSDLRHNNPPDAAQRRLPAHVHDEAALALKSLRCQRRS